MTRKPSRPKSHRSAQKATPRRTSRPRGGLEEGTADFPTNLDGEHAWESAQGPSWDETGSAPERAFEPREAQEADERRALNLAGGGALNDEDELEQPEAPELVQSGPERKEPEHGGDRARRKRS